jgi:transmembrane sensor
LKPDILRLQQLLQKDSWTEEEVQWLQSYLHNDTNTDLRDLLRETFKEDLAAGRKIDPVLSARMRERIFSEAMLVESGETGSKPVPFIRRGMAAAAILLLIFSGWVIYRGLRKNEVKEPASTVAEAPHLDRKIVPGGDKAVLQLANGSVIVLDSAGNGNLATEGDARVSKQDGKVFFAASGSGSASEARGASGGGSANGAGSASAAMTYNVLTTPKGGQYQIVLEDGTRVWLNAASSLRFPTTFSGSDRQVEMTGEAYFEVAKNKDKPFRVLVNHQLQADVLGTSFNIMAYGEEPTVNTTLVDGSVRLVKGQASVLLKPDQEGSIRQEALTQVSGGEDAGGGAAGAGFKVSDANVENALAWKNGVFQFDNLPLQTIMRQIARWYDVDVSYRVGLRDQVYSGTMPRKENISEVLKMLEYTGTIHFIMEGKTIIVTQ